MPTTVRDIDRKYREGEPITMLPAYDAGIARLVEAGGVDVVLVGDTAGHNHLGYEDTIPVTMDEALSNTGAVARGTEEALVVADLPFNSYGASIEQGVENAGALMKEGADAIKFETAPQGEHTVELAERCVELGMPVQGHVGLTPQHWNEIGGPVVQGRGEGTSASADALVEAAQRLEAAGVFSLVVETVTEAVGKRVTEAVDVPTIGIGAGRFTDGQVLVTNDVLGLDPLDTTLAKQYADLDAVIEGAVGEFVDDVERGRFPAREHVYDPVEE